MLKKKPCCICRTWFWPNPKTEFRQVTCGRPECQREHHRRNCVRYRLRNRDEERVFRLQMRARKEMEESSPVRVEREEVAGGTILEGQIRRVVRDEIRSEVPEIIGRIYRVLPFVPRDEKRTEVAGIIDRFRTEIPSMMRDEIAQFLSMSYGADREGQDASGMSPSGPEVRGPPSTKAT